MGIMSSIFGKATSQDVQTNTTSTYNSSDTYSNTDSHNLALNTSNSSTVSTTESLAQDRRLVTDHGIGVSADNSTVFTRDSGNSYASSTENNITNLTDFGAMSIGGALGLAGIAANRDLALGTIDASKYVVGSNLDMMRANLAYGQNLTNGAADLALKLSQGAAAESRNAIREVTTATSDALQRVVDIAAKPLNANDPQRLVIIVAMGVIGIVFLSKIKG